MSLAPEGGSTSHLRERGLRLAEQRMDQPQPRRPFIRQQADPPPECAVRQGELAEPKSLWPRRRPVRQQRHAESAIDHDDDGFQTVELEQFARPDAMLAQIGVDALASKDAAVESDERLLGENGVGIAAAQ